MTGERRRQYNKASAAASTLLALTTLTACGAKPTIAVEPSSQVHKPKNACQKFPSLLKKSGKLASMVTLPDGTTTIPTQQVKDAIKPYKANQLYICKELFRLAGQVVRLYEDPPAGAETRIVAGSYIDMSVQLDVEQSDSRYVVVWFNKNESGGPDLNSPNSVTATHYYIDKKGHNVQKTVSVEATGQPGLDPYAMQMTTTKVDKYEKVQIGNVEFNPSKESQKQEANQLASMAQTAADMLVP